MYVTPWLDLARFACLRDPDGEAAAVNIHKTSVLVIKKTSEARQQSLTQKSAIYFELFLYHYCLCAPTPKKTDKNQAER